MEPISLTLNSPRVALTGLDDAIGKLERVDMLIDKLSRQGRIKISLQVEGTDGLEAAQANLNGLKVALKELGRGDLATKLDAGLIGVGETARWAKGEIAKLGRELDQATLKSVQMQGKFEEMNTTSKGDILRFANHDKMAALRKELESAIGEADALQARMGQLQRLRGFAEGVSGTPEAAPARAAAVSNVAASGAMAASAVKQSAAAETVVRAQQEGLNITRQQLDEHRKLFELTHQVAQQHQAINAPKLGVERVVTAYRELTAESGKAAVSISDLQRRSGVEMKEVQEWIRKQRAAKRATLVEGDWNEATDPMREAAMKAKVGKSIRPHMFVEVSEPGMEKLGGPNTAVSEHAKSVAALSAAAKAAEALGVSEGKLVQPANASAAALGHQEAVVREKIAAMGSLNGVTQTLAGSERKLADAATQSARATAAAGEVSRRVLTDKAGNVARQSVTYSEGPGQTRTTLGRGGLSSTSTSQLGIYQAELMDVRLEYAARRAAMNEAGSPKGSAEHLDLIRQEAEARRTILDRMNDAGLSGERMYQTEAMRLRGMDEAVSRQQQMNNLKAAEGARKEMGSQLDSGFRERAAMLEREFATMKALNPSRVQEIDLLRRQSEEYGKLGAAMEASGRGRTTGGLGARRQEEVLGAKAHAMQAEMDREQQTLAHQIQQANAEFNAFGGKEKRTVERQGGAGTSIVSRRERDDPDGYRRSIELTRSWGAANDELAPKLVKSSVAMEGTGRSATAAGKSMLDNLGTVTAWSASVAILYKGLALLGFGATSMAKLEYASARLSAVFRGTNEQLNAQSPTITALRDRTLELAVANGRSGDEAMDAAVRWSRLGLTAKQVLEAVDVSLKAANVAEISTSEAAEQLSAVFAAYQLQVGELRTVLGELNSVSNNYNVTNKDLLSGLGRTSAIAKQAGISFSELIGIIGSGVGRTGRSGAEIGNAVKAFIVSLNNPTIQKALNGQFKLDVKTPRGEMKDMSTILNEVFVMFQKLDKADQGGFLQKVGGKLQASRLQAVMDGYVTGQMLAIKAQRDLGSAESENEKIRSTTLSQLASLSTAYQRLATNALTFGGDGSVAAQFKELIELITNVISLMADWPSILIVIMALMAALGVRIARIMASSSADTTILGRTVGHLKTLWTQFAEAVTVGNLALAQHNALARATPAAGPGAAPGAGAAVAGAAGGTAARAAGGGILMGIGRTLFSAVFSKEMAIFLAVTAGIELAMAGLNKLFAYFGNTADKAAEKLGVYNKELERTKALAGAAEMGARLFGTVSKTIPDLNVRSPRAAQHAIDDVAESRYSAKDDPDGSRRRALREELQVLLASGDMKKLQSRLDQEQVALAIEKRGHATVELEIKKKQVVTQAMLIAQLEKERDVQGRKGKNTGDQEKKLTEARRVMAELQGDVTRAFTATFDADEASVPEEERGFKEQTKSEFKGVEKVYESMPTTGGADEEEKANRKIKAENALLNLLFEKQDQLKRNSAAAIAAADAEYGKTEREWRGLQSLRDQRELLAREVEKSLRLDGLPTARQKDGSGGRARGSDRTRIAGRRLAEFDEANAAALEKDKQLSGLREVQSDQVQNLQGHQEALTKAVQKEIELQEEVLDKQKAQLETAREYARLQDAINEGKRKGKDESIQFQTGRNETEQMINESRGIGRLVADPAKEARVKELEERAKTNVTEEAITAAKQRFVAAEPNPYDKIRGVFGGGWEGVDKAAVAPSYPIEGGGKAYKGPTSPVAFAELGEQDAKNLDAIGDLMRRRQANVSDTEIEDAKSQASQRSLGNLNGLLGGAVADRSAALGKEDKIGQSRSEAEILQLTNRLSEISVRLEERRYQLARDIVNERQKEATEASKALLTATREEQLRAALLKRFTQDNGPVSVDQFQFLDKGTQEALQKFSPDQAPKELGSRSDDLEREQKTLLLNIKEVGDAMKEIGTQVKEMNLNSTVPGNVAPGGGLAAAPQIPAPNVQLQFAEQFQQLIDITKDTVVVALQGQIDGMRADFSNFQATLRQANAQRSGAETLAG